MGAENNQDAEQMVPRARKQSIIRCIHEILISSTFPNMRSRLFRCNMCGTCLVLVCEVKFRLLSGTDSEQYTCET
ncbi:unnamed protein product [Litomosoides sigmodontis]|uniref:Uncharacterized protein n=1 Tax=Litomosoides sigmodontis TaxID=42156 RepID=A0A3P6TPH3_LITSI|nr:unnamed protein product [Litomosoides sigmodontis]